MQRSIDRTIGHRTSRLIVHKSLIATTSRTISCDGSCHRYSPIVRDSATTRRPLLEIVAKISDRSHLGPIATNRAIQKSYDPMCLTVALGKYIPILEICTTQVWFKVDAESQPMKLYFQICDTILNNNYTHNRISINCSKS